MNNLILKFTKKLKEPKFLIIVGIFGIILIFLSSFMGGQSKEENHQKKAEGNIIIEEYRKSLEKDISNIVSGITGSKKINVIVTLESGIRYSYADTYEKSSADKTDSTAKSSDFQLKEGYITIKTSDGGEKALLITEQMPEIRGVAIVCEGGDNEIINEKIQNTVTAALNITSKRVYICGRKQQ